MGGDSGLGPGRSFEPAPDGDGGTRDDRDDPREHSEAPDEEWDDDVLDGPSSMGDGWDDDIADEPRKRRDTWRDDPAYGDPADELPRLMAKLGRLIARYGPGGVVAMARSDAERRELTAYAAGWQDAAAEFAPRVAAARRDGWLGRWRPLRVLNGPGDVIPFPVARQYAHPAQPAQLPDEEAYQDAYGDAYPARRQAPGGDVGGHGWDTGYDAGRDSGRDPAPDAGMKTGADRGQRPGHVPQSGQAGRQVPGRAREPESDQESGEPGSSINSATHGGRSAGDDDFAHGGRDEGESARGTEQSATRAHDEPGQGRAGRSAQGPRPSLPAKSRWSRSPTIPRLTPPQRPPGRGPDGTPPPDPSA